MKTASGRRQRRARRKGQWFRRCSPTCTYLHYVFDLWVEQWRKRQARGDVIVVRYADDLVLGFEHRKEAERFLKEFGDVWPSSAWSYIRTRRG